MKSSRLTALGLYFLFLVYLPFTGYSYVSIRGGSQIIDKDVRAAVILLLFAMIAALFVLTRRVDSVPRCVIGLGSFFFYGLAISAMRNSPQEYVSYFLRIASIVLIFWMSYSWAKRDRDEWWRFARNIVVGSSLIYVAQSVIDLLAGRALAMNGAIRFPGSLGSPPGYASVCMIFLLANTYFLLRTRSKIHLALSLLLVVCSFLTGTRAIAVAGLLVLSLTVVAYHRSIYVRAILLLVTFSIAPFAIGWVLNNTEIGSRVALSLGDQGNDTSTNFRLMILSTYFSHISTSQFVFGLGIGGFPKWFEAQTSIQDVGPHFEFLWALSELGVVGSGIYILVLFGGARLVLSRRSQSSRAERISALVLILCQQLIFQFTNPLYFYQLCLPALFMLGGMLGSERGRNT
ncbi:O-antigen ligase family protein [Caballeronia sp. LZ029]|uniref:O-antigen ligase family protein n=1 Tax=Caballeronia sp. LZ029 TaxID=3038564 RepID=UPI0028660B7D|nr:O-antigen ligase family protein [Caballeronia sp. LZ029]MDR5744245.1 O-antigen ligase family protein [Caballeronia sp. LZ029]